MDAQIFDPMDPISMFGFIHAFIIVCDNNCIHEGAAVWFPYFMEESAAAPLTVRFSIKSESSHYIVNSVLTAYCHVAKHLLKAFATDTIIAGTASKTAGYFKPSTI